MTDKRPQTIQFFLPQGEPRGIRIADITTRIVQAVLVPRSKLSEAAKREELKSVGVYFLFGEPEEAAKPVVYIGETEDCYARFGLHNRNKDFWHTAVAVVSKTGNFTKAHAKYLEWHCIRKAKEVGRFSLDNANEGKTPEATMYAQVLTEIRRYQKRGEQPRFVQHGRGFVGLTRWMGKGLEFQIEQHNKRIRKDLHKRLLAMDATEFEQFVGHRLLAALGFEDIEITKRSKDGGIDVRGTMVVEEVIRIRMAVQVKKWKNNVGTETVQQVRGSLGTHEQGLIITTGDFSPRARAEAARPNAVPVALMNGEQLVALLADKEIGIVRNSHDIFELAADEDLPCEPETLGE